MAIGRGYSGRVAQLCSCMGQLPAEVCGFSVARAEISLQLSQLISHALQLQLQVLLCQRGKLASHTEAVMVPQCMDHICIIGVSSAAAASCASWVRTWETLAVNF